MVSNQLGSPASGDVKLQEALPNIKLVSNQLGSPASGDELIDRIDMDEDSSFQSIRVSSEWRHQ